MAVALYGVLAYIQWGTPPGVVQTWERPALDPMLLDAFVLTFIELAIVTAMALFFSTFSTPLLSAALTFGFFVAGRFSADLRNFDQAVDSRAAGMIAKGLYWILPNLASFDVRAQVVHGQPITLGYVALMAGYGALYISGLVVAAMLIFSRRDFK
jgi:hypothetical protein